MEKQKSWQLWLIIAVFAVVLYSILPTIFWYTRPLKTEVGPKQADFTRDGRIDIEDFAVFSRSWDTTPSQTNWYVLCDLFEDDAIDINDLAALVADWIWVTEWH